MKWSVIASGLGGAALLALGSNFVIPLSSVIGSLADLAGVASIMVSFGLADGS